MFYKVIENNIITESGFPVIPPNGIEITEEEYNSIMETIRNKPEDTLETSYYLSADTETYVGRDTTHAEKAAWYAYAVLSEQMTIDEVPEDYKAEVEAMLPTPEPEKYTLDEAAALLTEEVANEV